MNRIIQVPVDEGLLKDLDALSGKRGQARAVVIREACRRYVAAERRQRLDEIYEESYRRVPESPEWGAATAVLAAEVWGPEDWSDCESP